MVLLGKAMFLIAALEDIFVLEILIYLFFMEKQHIHLNW